MFTYYDANRLYEKLMNVLVRDYYYEEDLKEAEKLLKRALKRGTKKMLEYRYEELREKAIQNPTDENLDALGEWLQQYGTNCWNGEEWNIDKRYFLRPEYNQEPDEYGNFPINGYTLQK